MSGCASAKCARPWAFCRISWTSRGCRRRVPGGRPVRSGQRKPALPPWLESPAPRAPAMRRACRACQLAKRSACPGRSSSARASASSLSVRRLASSRSSGEGGGGSVAGRVTPGAEMRGAQCAGTERRRIWNGVRGASSSGRAIACGKTRGARGFIAAGHTIPVPTPLRRIFGAGVRSRRRSGGSVTTSPGAGVRSRRRSGGSVTTSPRASAMISRRAADSAGRSRRKMALRRWRGREMTAVSPLVGAPKEDGRPEGGGCSQALPCRRARQECASAPAGCVRLPRSSPFPPDLLIGKRDFSTRRGGVDKESVPAQDSADCRSTDSVHAVAADEFVPAVPPARPVGVRRAPGWPCRRIHSLAGDCSIAAVPHISASSQGG